MVVEKGSTFSILQGIKKEFINQTTPFGEDLEIIKVLEIKGLEELFPKQLEEPFIAQIKSAQSYQQLVQVRNNFLAQHLTKKQSGESKEVIQSLPELKPWEITKYFDKERYVWIGLLTIALVSLGGLMVRLRNSKIKR